MTRRVLFVFVAAWTVIAFAQAQPEFSGYYENTLQVDVPSGEEETLINASKLRLDVEAGGGEQQLTFRGNVNFIRYHGTTTVDAEPYLPPEVVAAMRMFGQSPEIELDRSRIYLDNAWLTWNVLGLTLRAGKQLLSWGPAYSINPTDLFHDKTLLDPTYEKEGVGALRLDYRWGIGGQLALIMAPDEQFETAGYALRAATYLSSIGYDVALTAHSVIDSTSLDPVTLLPRTQQRQALGLEFAGSLFGLGVWMEGNHNWMEHEDEFIRVAAGTDYTLSNGLYLMLEAFYNGRADWDPPYPLSDWLANLLYGEPIGPGWLMAGTRYDFSLLVNGALYAFATPDETYLINPRVNVSIARNADLTLFGGVTLGADNGTFPSGLVSGYARVNVYF